MRELSELLRPNIKSLAPYSCARNEYSGTEAHIFLDANENPFTKPYNRYPDPLQTRLKQRIAQVKGVKEDCIFLGNGSDEAIDLVYRCFARPGHDNVVAIEPTYGMYKVCADINDVEYRRVTLGRGFQLDADRLLAACDANTKAVWLCTPNNPTGNSLDQSQVEAVLDSFDGLVVIDEAYGDFSSQPTFRRRLAKYPNMIVLNTMSKAWGCAALRLGMAFASSEIIGIFNKVKYPYNISLPTQELAMEALEDPFEADKWVRLILQERERLADAIAQLPMCRRVHPSDANFLLAEMVDAEGTYEYLKSHGIIVRDRSRVTLCGGCLRITIGTRTENNELVAALRQMP